MILLAAGDPTLTSAVRHVARRDEDVVHDPRWVDVALERGSARVLVCDDRRGLLPETTTGVPVVCVLPETLARWDRERRERDVPPLRAAYVARRLAPLVAERARERLWVDRVLADLGRLAGAELPLPFRAFARRTLELPPRYTDLNDLAEATELSRGALKARFRRRGLESPFTYLRWLRTFAVAEVLADPAVTVAVAAYRLGFTSDTNMCRMVRVLTGATPGQLRESGARRWLRVAFAHQHLDSKLLAAWATLDGVFERQVA